MPVPLVTRREAIGVTAGALLVASGRPASAASATPQSPNAPRPYLETAQLAARWIGAQGVRDDHGMYWPADPLKPGVPDLDLYNSTPGVVPFWLELYHATDDAQALVRAGAGADWVMHRMTEKPPEGSGLYEGWAGLAWMLALTHRATRAARHREGALQAHAQVKQRAVADPSGRGVRWIDSTDIISGAAGTGLYLLWAQREFRDPTALDLAVRAGTALIAASESAGSDQRRWKVNASIGREYPNFSHGTAGVAYFLACLHQATGQKQFLDAALDGARYLTAIAKTTEHDGRMIHHSAPGNESLFYLSWCHGPAGTARLFHKLSTITGDRAHAEMVTKLVQATHDMKVPERSAGFWNNISQCCGNCGVVEFFAARHAMRHEAADLAYAEQVAQDAIARGTREGEGMKWVQAENRVSPNAVVAQTGLMQGAAGVGLAMLHLDGVMQKRKPAVTLPDNPFV